MGERVIMNTSNLQKLFPQEYEDFFTKNNLIVSCPQVINRGNLTHLEGIKEKVVQKLPTKLYIGINIRNDNQVKINSFTSFINATQKFSKSELTVNGDRKMVEKLEHAIKKKLLEYGYTKGIEINVLTENERGTGTAVASMKAMLLSLVLHILSGKILPEQLDDYTTFIKAKECKSIYMTAKNILGEISPIDQKHINGTILFTIAINNGNVGLGFGNKGYLDANYPKVMQCENSICLGHTSLDHTKIAEYSILNFGNCYDEFYCAETYFKIQEEYEDIIKQYGMERINPSLFMDTLNFLYLKFFQTAKEAMIHPNDEQLIDKYFGVLKRLSGYETFIEGYFDLYRDITTSFKENITFEDEKLGLIPISSAKPGGTFICITKPGKSRETLKKVLQDLHDKGYITANLQYTSREDGISEEHLKIEQYLDEGRFSQYIKDGDVVLECYGIDCGKKTIGNHREILESTKDGITFDAVDGKIYINNTLTNHNEILTQSGTVDTIKILLENQGKYINNSKLPVSSYTKNKNEMVGKIIGPLQELVQKKFNDKLDLQCTGNIVNFDLKLTPNQTRLYLIKKTH